MRAISAERFSRISGPMRHDEAVMMISSEKTCHRAPIYCILYTVYFILYTILKTCHRAPMISSDAAALRQCAMRRGTAVYGAARRSVLRWPWRGTKHLPDLHLALVTPRAKVLLGLVNHLGHHRLQALGVHRVHEQLHLLLPLLKRRVVHDALAEDRYGEAVHRRL